ncbi:MAG: 4-alpha-glucanotransferase [Acidimicrobiales bacterium]
MTDPAAWGITPGYHDYRGEWRAVGTDTATALLAAMGAEEGAPPPPQRPGPDGRSWVVTVGPEPVVVPGRWQLRTDDGAEVEVDGSLPADLGPGYHELVRHADGHRTRLVLAPGRCHLPEGLRTWGWAVQLYAARSAQSWGIGDLADLRRLGRWSAAHGAGMALVNPLHAASSVGPQQPSPYSPSSRCYRNPLYLRVEEVPGAGEAGFGVDLDRLASAGRALNADRRIDRDAVWALKREALELLWSRFGGDRGFDRYCHEEGPALAAYATFCALAEQHGSAWTNWPDQLRHPENPEVLAFVDAHRDRIHFHQWLQWLLDDQLAGAGAEIGIVTDLAIGVDPAGADAWLWSDCLVPGARVGAPPDEFATSGQDWGIPPFDPWRLRDAAYEPFIRTLRAGFRHAAGLRIDHVMGLFRLFWVPQGLSPAEGAYVAYPWQDLLGIVALESWRAGAWVVGEDLGTVEPMVREELGRRGVLSYRVAWFEDEPPRHFPSQALAAVTTHDLPTVAGLWEGEDLFEQEELGLAPNLEATMAIRDRIGGWAGLDETATIDEVVVAVHRLLGEAPSAVVAATLDDALGVVERPNMPGVPTDRRANWCLALPATLEEIETDPTVSAVVAALLAGRGGAGAT